MRFKILATALAAAALCAPMAARAAAIFQFSEVGGDLVGKLTGSINLSGASLIVQNLPAYGSGLLFGTSAFPYFQVQASNDVVDNQASSWLLESGGILGAQNLKGAKGVSSGGTAKFELAYFPDPTSRDYIYLPSDYVSGSALDRTLTLASQSFQSLGITAGDYVYTLAGSHDTVTLRFQNTTQVPEPGALALASLALGAAAWSRRKPAAAPQRG